MIHSIASVSRPLIASATLAITIILHSTAQSQNAPMNQPSPDEMFRHLDVNRDGKLTLDETRLASRQFVQQVFQMAGKPTSASISREEFAELVARHRRGNTAPQREGSTTSAPVAAEATGLPPVLRSLDSNGDQRLTRAELSRLLEQFGRLDSNSDGALDLEELRSAEQKLETGRPSPDTSTPAVPSTNDRSTESSASSSSTARPASGRREEESRPVTTSSSGAQRLAGVWRGWVVDGRGDNPNAGHMELELRIEGNRIVARELGTKRSGDGLGNGTFVISGTGPSGNLDATGTSGQYLNETYQGIYRIEGDTLRWCVGNRGRSRPGEFETGRGNYLMILRRQAAG